MITQLIIMLVRTSHEYARESMLKDLGRAELVILDEFGYVPFDIKGARLLFQVMSDCYKRKSAIVTITIEFSKWGAVLGNDKLTAAIIDRLVHYGRFVEFDGASKRARPRIHAQRPIS